MYDSTSYSYRGKTKRSKSKAKQKVIQNSFYKGGLQYHFIVEHELRDQGIDETNFDKHPDNPHVQGNK